MKKINIQIEARIGTKSQVFFPEDVSKQIRDYQDARRRAYGKAGMDKGEVLIIAFRHGGAEWLRDQTEFLNALADQGKNKKNGKAKP